MILPFFGFNFIGVSGPLGISLGDNCLCVDALSASILSLTAVYLSSLAFPTLLIIKLKTTWYFNTKI